MTRRVHRVPLGPFVFLFLILMAFFSDAQSTSTSSISSPSRSVPTSTAKTSTTSSSTTSPSATAAAEPKNMLVTVSYVGIGVGCAIILIFVVTIFFSWRQKQARASQPPMSEARKEYIESFRNRQNNGGNDQGGAGQGNITGVNMVNNAPWNAVQTSNTTNGQKANHERSGSKSSLGRFHFRSHSKSHSQEVVTEPIMTIEVTSNPSLRPTSVIPDALVPKRLKPQQQQKSALFTPASQPSPMPKFEVPGKVIYEEPKVSEPPHAITTSDNGNGYKFPPRTTSRRAPPTALAIRPFTPGGSNPIVAPNSGRSNQILPLRNFSPYQPEQLTPIQMQPIRPYSPLESGSGGNVQAQPYIPSWMNMPNQYPKLESRSTTPKQPPPQNIPRELRPVSSTTIASETTTYSEDEYSDFDDEENDEDRNYDYRSEVYDSYRRSMDSYDDDRRPLSAMSYDSGWSYGPSRSSRDMRASRGRDELYHVSKLTPRDRNGRQKTPVNDNSMLSPSSVNTKTYGRDNGNTRITPPPPPPPKDWEVVAIKMDPYPAFAAAVRPSPSARGNTPKPILKGGLPNNPKVGRSGGQNGWEADLERGEQKPRVRF